MTIYQIFLFRFTIFLELIVKFIFLINFFLVLFIEVLNNRRQQFEKTSPMYNYEFKTR